MPFIPTLNEFVHKNDGDSLHKSIIDDICEFPEGKERFELRLQAIQRLDDIVMFHRFVMVTYKNNQQVIESGFEAFNEHYNGVLDNVCDGNPEQVATTRMVFNVYDVYMQQSQIKCIANESMVINLWATIEQYASRSLHIVTRNEVSSSCKWYEIVEKFNAHGLDIKKLSAYESIDEIRVLNNKIKHSYRVDDQLAKFKFFSEYNEKPINYIPLRVKDYTIATYHFIVQLINIIGPSERYPDDEED